MSKRNQRCLAAAVLAGAFLLTAPAPSQAAGFWRPAAEVSGLAVRAWFWLEMAVWGKEGSAIDPDGVTVVWEKEGSAIDPNGAPRTSSTPTPPATALADSTDSPGGSQ